MSTEERIPDYLAIAEAVTQRSEFKEALDSVIAVVRSVFLFDNLALYLSDDTPGSFTEIVYARAVGRGQTAGADAAWGADLANNVCSANEMIVQEPSKGSSKHDRLRQPHLLGLPLRTYNGVLGALIFIRFGGPTYTPTQIQRAQFIATQFASLFEREKNRQQITALQEARHLLALQEDFIATVSHELRTPLGFIKGYSTTLLRQDTVWDETTRREFLTIIDEEADHLTMLIENVLESSRLQSNTLPMRFQPVRLDALIRDTVIRGHARYKDTPVEVDFQVTPIVKADGVRIAQVLDNLFSNAVKYAPNAPIKVTLSQEGDYYRIRFADSGPGISPEHIENLFKRFFRVPGQGGSGSGLGLFICKKIVEAHGGNISVESMLGVGTTFLIDLPAETGIRTS